MENFAADLRGDIAAMKEELARVLESTEKVWAVIDKGREVSLCNGDCTADCNAEAEVCEEGALQDAVADLTVASGNVQEEVAALDLLGGKLGNAAAVMEGTSSGPPPPPPPQKAPLPPCAADAGVRKTRSMSRREDERTRVSVEAGMHLHDEEERDNLRRMFSSTEELEAKEEAVKEAKKRMCRYMLNCIRTMTPGEMETMIDIAMGVVICINAGFIGVSMDHGTDSIGWTLLDCSFSAIFIFEIALKVALHGFEGHFCGSMCVANNFDAGLILIDLVQLIWLTLGGENSAMESLPPASLFRMLRLIKLARLLKVVKLDIFKDVLSMVSGIIGGMTTLMWSMLLFLVVVYITALLFREFFGRRKVDNVFELFNTVPRSMLTTFRCSFGDCSTAGGVPIFEYVHESYGGFASLCYCIFVFSITIGIFNVISAIFVESTMNAASALDRAEKNARLADRELWNTRITTLIRAMVEVSELETPTGKLSDASDDIFYVQIKSKLIDELVELEHVKDALDDLDINPDDHKQLSELLDPDHGGTIGVVDFIDGVRRLRGEPRRSDIVNINMMVRSLQAAVAETHVAVSHVIDKLARIHDAVQPLNE